MPQVSWPAALLLSVLLVCTTYLVSKGIVPSHLLFTIAGIVVGYVIPKARVSTDGALASRAHARSSGDFSPEEIPTKKDLRSEAVTLAMPAAKRPMKPEDD